MHAAQHSPTRHLQILPEDDQTPASREAVQGPWGRRTLQFIHAWSLMGAGAITLSDLRPLFALAPRGALALTVDALVQLDCLVPLDEASYFVGPRVSSLAPRSMR